jgi:macrolide-specific efflux system membrane fusion protein
MKTLAIVAAVLTAGSGLWFVARSPSDAESNGDGSSEPTTAVVARRDIGAAVLATGVVRPQVGAEVQVGSRISGVLERLYVTVGDRVRRGQLLAQLDSTEHAARYAEALAAVETARAEHAFAAQEFARAEAMQERDVIPEAEYERAARLRDVTQSQVKQAQANLQSSQIQMGYTRIIAPIGGVVANVSTQVGETVAASLAAPTFVTIIDLDRLEVWAYVDETDIGRIEVGQHAVFTLDTYPEDEFDGVVTAIRPKAEIQNGVVNYVTVIEIADGHGRILRPEMTTTVNIMLERRADVLAVPGGAVRRDREGTYVFLLRDGVSVKQPIRTGYRGRAYAEVVEGLNEGDTIVVRPPAR